MLSNSFTTQGWIERMHRIHQSGLMIISHSYLFRLRRSFARLILREDAVTHSTVSRRDARRDHQTRDYLSARDDHPACVMRKDICCPATPLGERDVHPSFFSLFSFFLSFSVCPLFSLALTRDRYAHTTHA